jgi:hypothetical protein
MCVVMLGGGGLRLEASSPCPQQHVVISWPNTKGSVIVLGRHGNMVVFQLPKGDEITTCGYRVVTSVECRTVMTVMLMVIRGLGS